MATIDIRRPHTLEKEEAKRRSEALARSMEDKLGIRWRWEGDKIRFETPSGAAKGTNGTVHVDPNDVRVEIDLPFLLRAIKGSVESKINQQLDEVLGKVEAPPGS
jgi:putative polyhydroxyalkanoate system protein